MLYYDWMWCEATYSMKYGTPSSVYAISQLLGNGPRLEVLWARSRDFFRVSGIACCSAISWLTGLDVVTSMLERLRRRFPSDDGVCPGNKVPMEFVRLNGLSTVGSLAGFGVPYWLPMYTTDKTTEISGIYWIKSKNSWHWKQCSFIDVSALLATDVQGPTAK